MKQENKERKKQRREGTMGYFCYAKFMICPTHANGSVTSVRSLNQSEKLRSIHSIHPVNHYTDKEV